MAFISEFVPKNFFYIILILYWSIFILFDLEELRYEHPYITLNPKILALQGGFFRSLNYKIPQAYGATVIIAVNA